MIEEALDAAKSTRLRLGTFSHLGEGPDPALEERFPFPHEALDFFSRPVNATLIAASLIAAAVLLDYVRGRLEARRLWRARAAALKVWTAFFRRTGGRGRRTPRRKAPGR